MEVGSSEIYTGLCDLLSRSRTRSRYIIVANVCGILVTRESVELKKSCRFLRRRFVPLVNFRYPWRTILHKNISPVLFFTLTVTFLKPVLFNDRLEIKYPLGLTRLYSGIIIAGVIVRHVSAILTCGSRDPEMKCCVWKQHEENSLRIKTRFTIIRSQWVSIDRSSILRFATRDFLATCVPSKNSNLWTLLNIRCLCNPGVVNDASVTDAFSIFRKEDRGAADPTWRYVIASEHERTDDPHPSDCFLVSRMNRATWNRGMRIIGES